MNMRKWIIAALLALAVTGGASAQKLLEYGVTAGVNMPNFTTWTPGAEIGNKLGWQAGVVVRINTPVVAIQPELLFVRQGLDVQWQGSDVRVKSNSFSLPLLASVRLLRILHINAGPVFSLTNDCKYKVDGLRYDFGRLLPSVGYAAGVALQLGHLMIDARYNGQFKRMRSVNAHGIDVDAQSRSVAVGLAYLF